MNENRRFECIMDIADAWIIWDNATNEPAQFSDAVLIGMTEGHAHVMCDLLNARGEDRSQESRRFG